MHDYKSDRNFALIILGNDIQNLLIIVAYSYKYRNSNQNIKICFYFLNIVTVQWIRLYDVCMQNWCLVLNELKIIG